MKTIIVYGLKTNTRLLFFFLLFMTIARISQAQSILSVTINADSIPHSINIVTETPVPLVYFEQSPYWNWYGFVLSLNFEGCPASEEETYLVDTTFYFYPDTSFSTMNLFIGAGRLYMEGCSYPDSSMTMDIFFLTGIPINGISNASNTLENYIKVFPNPSTDLVSIQGLPGFQDIRYEVLSLGGQVVQSGNLNDNTFSVSSLPHGVYVLALYTSLILTIELPAALSHLTSRQQVFF